MNHIITNLLISLSGGAATYLILRLSSLSLGAKAPKAVK